MSHGQTFEDGRCQRRWAVIIKISLNIKLSWFFLSTSMVVILLKQVRTLDWIREICAVYEDTSGDSIRSGSFRQVHSQEG